MPRFHLLVSTKQTLQHASTLSLCASYEQWNSLKGCVLACFCIVVLDSPFKRCHLNWSRVSLWCVAPEHASTCMQPQNVLSEEQTKFMQNCAWPLQPALTAAPKGHNKPAPHAYLVMSPKQKSSMSLPSVWWTSLHFFPVITILCFFFGFFNTIPWCV